MTISVAGGAHLQHVERLDGRLGLATGRAEGREVVPADQVRWRPAPSPRGASAAAPTTRGRGRAPAAPAAPGCGSGSGGPGAEAGVEVVGDLRAVDDGDRVGLEMEVERRAHRVGRPVADQLEVRDLAQRMHAGIRAAGAAHRHGLARQLVDGLGEAALHGGAGGLDLPADERRAVVFDGDAVAGHVLRRLVAPERRQRRLILRFLAETLPACATKQRAGIERGPLNGCARPSRRMYRLAACIIADMVQVGPIAGASVGLAGASVSLRSGSMMTRSLRRQRAEHAHAFLDRHRGAVERARSRCAWSTGPPRAGWPSGQADAGEDDDRATHVASPPATINGKFTNSAGARPCVSADCLTRPLAKATAACPPAAAKPRRNSSAVIGRLPARWACRTRTAPSPQAIVSRSSRTVPGRPKALTGLARSTLMRSGLSPLRTANQAPGTGDRPRMWLCTSPRRPAEVDAALVLADLGGVGDAVGRLRPAFAACRAPDAASARTIRRGAAPGEQVVQLAGRHVGRDRHALLQADRPGVQARLHAHDGGGRLGVARHDGALDGRGAAPARQRRGMQVEAAVPGRLQHRLAAGSARRPRPRRRRRDARQRPAARPRPSGILGATTAMPDPSAKACTGRLALAHAAAGRTRRLGIDRGHLVPRRQDSPTASGRRNRACP